MIPQTEPRKSTLVHCGVKWDGPCFFDTTSKNDDTSVGCGGLRRTNQWEKGFRINQWYISSTHKPCLVESHRTLSRAKSAARELSAFHRKHKLSEPTHRIFRFVRGIGFIHQGDY